MREEWGGALGRGLRSSIMSPLVLGSVDFASCKHCWEVEGQSQGQLQVLPGRAVLELVRPKEEQNGGMSNGQMDR